MVKQEMSNILLLTDIIEQKVRKEKELEYYQKQLEELQQKMWWITKEIEVTNLCIQIIENEKANIVSNHMLEKHHDEENV